MFALLLGLAQAQAALPAATSPGPTQVEVTVYRDLARGSGRPNLQWLNGYALISEIRQVTIPAGESDLRFEGVASGMVPQSAIVSGLPQGIVERNRDAYLLSPGSLIDRSLGKRVTLRRTDRATGRVTTEEAVVRTGGDGGVVLQTPAGIEALRCSGLAETLTYPQVPAGLSPKPTLSVRVRARQPLTATIRLSYLATGFDWQADYVGILSADERSLHLQAWLTLASSDDTSFVGATTQAVAGRVNREDAEVQPVEAPPVRLSCWPEGTTTDGLQREKLGDSPPPPPPPPPAPMAVSAVSGEEIIVTGSRVVAQRERLGDLQLYRIPEPVTVAANAQKQVGLLDQPAVKVTPVYRFALQANGAGELEGQLQLRTQNRTSEGLGLPLPAGNLVLFRQGANRPILIGEAPMADRTIGEKVELRVATSPGVRGRLVSGEQPGRYLLTLTNDRPVPVQAEVALDVNEGQSLSGDTRLVRRDGQTLWNTTVPPNGSVSLRYRIRD